MEKLVNTQMDGRMADWGQRPSKTHEIRVSHKRSSENRIPPNLNVKQHFRIDYLLKGIKGTITQVIHYWVPQPQPIHYWVSQKRTTNTVPMISARVCNK